LLRESPRMVNNLLTELRNNPDYATANQRIQEFMAGARQQCESLRTQMQQNHQQNTESHSAPQQNAEPPAEQNVETNVQLSQPSQNAEAMEEVGTFPPSVQSVLNFFQQLPVERPTSTIQSEQTASEAANNASAHSEGHQQQYPDLINLSGPSQFEEQCAQSEMSPVPNIYPSAPQQEPHVQEIKNVEPMRAHSSTSNTSRGDSTWIFVAKGISGYVRHVKTLSQRVPYHRNFCSAQDWTLPDGKTIKVELVHALHPDAPFICLFDYDTTTDMFFVQTLLDGNGKEIHKIDSFSNSYQGFSPDMLLQSAEIDDCVRIRIEAIVELD
jgi:hypothetical protein